MALLQLEAFRSLLAQNLSEDEALRHLRASSEEGNWQEAWRRCSLLRYFDEESFGRALAGVESPPEFAAFIQAPELERLETGRFAVRAVKRGEALRQWRSGPTLRRFALSMSEYYRLCEDELSVLAMQLLADPSAAKRQFEALYAEADGRFDVPACSQLIEILRARYELLKPSLQDLWRTYDVYLRARIMFADDYYRSASYLERTSLTEALGEFLDSNQQWLLRLYGKGGSGKTMFVRWLVARRCLPRLPGRVPIAVARVDFDALSLNAFAAQPWLTLLYIARQLSPQLPENPFQEILQERGSLLPMLLGNEGLPADLAVGLAAEKDWIVRHVCHGIGSQTVLIILDTCEDPLIHRRAAFKELLDLLAEARQGPCHNLRVIASGRYDICEKGRLPAFVTGSSDIEVGHFTEEEATEYLIEKRGMLPGELVNAIANRSHGNPFSLGLFAELALSPDFGVKDVEEAPEDDFIYLLDRVILRIPQEQEPVRWLVRYAVIPRELTFDFALKVLSPLLADRSRDPANQFDGNLEQFRDLRIRPGIARAVSFLEIWNQLKLYASNPSWIVWNEHNDTLKLQSEVVVPMRKLLQGKKQGSLYNQLEANAEKYWRDRAEQNHEEFGRFMAEAMFQLFQRIGSKAAEHWSLLLDDSRVRTAADRMHLGEMILDNSFLDDSGTPRRDQNGRPMVARKTVLQARFVVATCALTEWLRLGRPREQGEFASARFSDQWEYLSHAPANALSQPEGTLLRSAAAHLGPRRAPDAGGPVSKASWSGIPKHRQLLWYVLLGQIATDRAAAGFKSSGSAFPAALQLSKSIHSRDFPLHHIRYHAGMFHFRRGQLPLAAKAFEQALETISARDPLSPYREECFWRLIWVLRRSGRWREALAVADRFRGTLQEPEPRFEILMFHYEYAQALIAMDLGELNAGVEHLYRARPDADSPAMLAFYHELAGECHLRGLQPGAAAEELAMAAQAYGPSRPASWRINILQAALSIATGDLQSARERVERDRHPYWNLGLELEAVRLHMGGRKYAAPPAGPPEVRAQVRALALALRRTHSPSGFLTEFGRLKIDDSKYAALIPFGESAAIRPRDDGASIRARSLFPKPPGRRNNPAFLIQTLALANGYRFFGDLATAKRILKRVPKQENAFLEWKRLRALHAAAPKLALDLAPFIKQVRSEFSQVPLMRVMIQTELAEWYLDWSKWEQAAALLGPMEQDFRQTGMTRSLWVARRQLIEGRLLGRQDEASAAAAFERAAATADAAGGDDLKAVAEAALKTLRNQGVATPTERPMVRAVDTWSFAITKKEQQLEVRFELTGKGGGRFVNDAPKWLLAQSSSSLPDWRAQMKELAKAATPFEQRVSPKANRLVLSGVLASLPWELLASPQAQLFYRGSASANANRETVVWMQSALTLLGHSIPVTGESSPQLGQALAGYPGDTPHAALRAALKKKGFDPMTPLVFCSEPDSKWQYDHKRGYALQSVSLENTYSVLGAYCKTELGPYAAPWTETPSAIHLVGTFLQNANAEVRFDNGGPIVSSSAYGGTMTLTAQDLSKRLSAWPTSTVRPLIVMDAICGNSGEAPRQAALRNDFCARLFDTGCARAVLGFGLAYPQAARGTLDTISRGFSKRHCVGELHRTLLAQQKSFHIPPALWTDDPDLPAFKA